MSLSGSYSKPHVILLGESVDRSVVACARSLSKANINFYICKTRGQRAIPWELTKFRDNIYPKRVSPTDNIDEFKKDILRVRKECGDIIIFPLGDGMNKNLINIKTWLEDVGIQFPVPEKEAYHTVDSKKSLMDICSNYEISTPLEYDEYPEKSDMPFVAKPKMNFNKDGEKLLPEIINNQRKYCDFINRGDISDYFFQEYVNGENFCVFFLIGENGQSIHYGHKVIKQEPNGGSVIKAIPYNPPSMIVNKLKNLLNDIGYIGIIMFEMIKNNNGDFKMIEANPRFWGPLQLCIDNGVDFPQYLYRLTVEKDFEFRKCKHNKKNGYIRYDGYVSGYWKVIKREGNFQENPYERDSYDISDTWLRTDTLIISPIKIGYKILNPLLEKMVKRW